MNVVIPELVTERREAKELSQAALAKLCCVKQQSIQQLESGAVRSPRYIVVLARVLDTTPEYLCGETDKPDGTAPCFANGGEPLQIAVGTGPNDKMESGDMDEVRLRLIKKIMGLSPSKLTALDVILSDDEDQLSAHPCMRGRA